jgi:hypothetical protein
MPAVRRASLTARDGAEPAPSLSCPYGTEGGAISRIWRLCAAGFAAIAISFGPARMGFSLFVPEFRSAFSMSTSAVGFVASLGFLGYFSGLLISQARLNRRGPAAPVVSGLVAATLGLGVVALAPSLSVLALWVFLATSSVGLAWTPYNDAMHRKVPEDARPFASSVVSTGTAVGVALAGVVALVPVAAMPALVFICYGLFGLAGLLAGRAREAIGLPSLSFTMVLLAAAMGSVVGPAVAGVVSDVIGARAMFLGAATLPALVVLLLRDRHVWDRPAHAAPQEAT